jgi:hypothetical protein
MLPNLDAFEERLLVMATATLLPAHGPLSIWGWRRLASGRGYVATCIFRAVGLIDRFLLLSKTL